MDIKEQLPKLLDLQKVDFEVYDLRAEKETFAEKINELDSLLEDKKTALGSAEEKLKALQVLKNEKENELRSGEERIKKHESELLQIKTNKEYTAMLEQIESAKADTSLLEEKIIGLLDDIEAAQAVLDKEKKLFEEERKRTEKEKVAVESRKKEINARLDELRGERDKLAGGLEERLLKRYEKILKNRGRCALSKIEGEFCEICNMRLRPQVINEVRLQKELITCENCSRILYTE